MGLSSFIGLGIAGIIIVMVFLIFSADKFIFNNKPYLISLLALSLIIVNWLLYLSNFYSVLPQNIGDIIFLPVWILVSIVGLIAAYKEYNNNRTFAVLNGGFAIISLVLGMLSWGIGNI